MRKFSDIVDNWDQISSQLYPKNNQSNIDSDLLNTLEELRDQSSESNDNSEEILPFNTPSITPTVEPIQNLNKPGQDLEKLGSTETPRNFSEDLRIAQQARNENELSANLLRAGGIIGSAFTPLAKENPEFNRSVESLSKSADRPVEILKEQLDVESSDPMSLKSKAAQELLIQKFPNQADSIRKMSMNDIQKLGFSLKPKAGSQFQKMQYTAGANGSPQWGYFDQTTGQMFDSSGKQLSGDIKPFFKPGLTTDPYTGDKMLVSTSGDIKSLSTQKKPLINEEDLDSSKIYSSLNKVQRVNADKSMEEFSKATKDYREAKNKAVQIKELLQKGDKEFNADILRPIQTAFARGAGESGAMTERDVSGYTGRQDYLSQLSRWISMGTTGKLNNEDRKLLTKLAEYMIQNNESAINKEAEFQSNFLKTKTGLSPEHSKLLLYQPNTNKKDQPKESKFKNILKGYPQDNSTEQQPQPLSPAEAAKQELERRKKGK